MEEKEVLQKAGETLTDKPLTVTFPLKNQKWYDKYLFKLGLKTPIHKIIINPLLVGNRWRIAARAVNIPNDVLKGGIVKALLNPGYANDCIYAVAVGIQNNEHEPTDDLLKFVSFQFDDSDMSKVLDAIFCKIPLEDFTKSIILLKGADILTIQMSPEA